MMNVFASNMADYERSELKATLSVTNIQYTGTLTVNSDYEQYSMCRNLVLSEKNGVRNQTTLLKSFLEDNSCCAQWTVSEQAVEHPRESYVNDEELKEVFAQLKAAIVSTSNSEVSVCKVPSDTTVESLEVQNGPKQWDTEKWKEFYDSQRSQKPAPIEKSVEFDVTTERPEKTISQDLRESRKDFFGRVMLNRDILEKLKVPQSQLNITNDDTKTIVTSTPPSEKIRERAFEKYTYTDHESWLFENLSPEQIEAYHKRQNVKAAFTPGFISQRLTNQLKHTEICEATRPNLFKKLKNKFEPHSKFPAFGEGNYTTTAVSKNYTFKPDEQMEINRANYVLDQRLLKLKNRKSSLNTSVQQTSKIRFDQSSSYINRMKEYRKIHVENEKLAKRLNPEKISTTRQLMNRSSVSSYDICSVSSKSSTSQFSSNMYTKAYNKKTVQRLAHSKNQYAPDKSPSKVPKKYKRPEWNIGHIDYKKTEVKPIKYKSIRKLPVISLCNSTSSSVLNSSRGSESKTKFPSKPKTAPTLRNTISSLNTNGHDRSNKIDETNGRKVNYSSYASKLNNMLRRNVERRQTSSNNSRIPIRRLDKSKIIDLNDTKFQVFQSLNETLFGHGKESNLKYAENNNNGNEIKREEIQGHIGSMGTEDNAVRRERGKFVMVKDGTVISSMEMGGGDATDALTYSDKVEDNVHEMAIELDYLDQSLDIDQDLLELSDLEETLSRTSSVTMEQESDSSTFSPRFTSPKRTFLEEGCVRSTSYGSLMRASYSNTLDIISERTESSISDAEESDMSADTNLHCEEFLDRTALENRNKKIWRGNNVREEDDSRFETSGPNLKSQLNKELCKTEQPKDIDEGNLSLGEIRRAQIATQLSCLTVSPKPVSYGKIFSILNDRAEEVNGEFHSRKKSQLKEDEENGLTEEEE